MDWKYILSLSPDNLSENEKDQLYTNIAWFDFDSEELDSKRSIALLKISQEIMKYKSEQIEALLAELDEVAARQGEEEAKKQETDDDDLHSLKSKKSQNSITYEDLEQKYKDVKSKLKQQIRLYEIQSRDMAKIKQAHDVVQEEKSHLQYELQAALNRGEDSQSDISESITDQQKELLKAVQRKNKQISQLLNDIEEIEKENLNLKENVSNLRDQLSDATNQVSLLTNDLTSLKIKSDDNTDAVNNLKEENEALRSQIQDFVEEKQQRDNEIDEFAFEIDTRIDKWKKILEEKDEEIHKLKTQIHQNNSNSSSDGIALHYHENQFDNETLNKAINERDNQLIELQKQLQSATLEMETSTQLLKQLSADKDFAVHKVDELTQIVEGLKMKLQAAHKRSQELQEGVSYVEGIAESRQEDLNEIIEKLKDDGEIELSECFKQIQELKADIQKKGKQISDYIRITNKLQESHHEIENENRVLRDKCGIGDDECVNVSGVLLRKYKQNKSMAKLQKRIDSLEEENIILKTEIRKFKNKLFSNLDEKFDHDNNKSEITTTKSNSVTNQQPLTSLECEQNQELLKENDALRKGLHEILESIKAKNETSKREIKSETLEKLLQALDVRHVSGWYHPAMRLQAELHTLQGTNTELRDQLKKTRLELNAYRETNKQNEITDRYLNVDVARQDTLGTTKEMMMDLNEHLLKVLDSYHKEESINATLVTKLEEYKNNFDVVERQLNLFYTQYIEEKESWKNREDVLQGDKNKIENQLAVLEAKLKEFANMNEDEYAKLERFAEMSANMVVLNRKCVYLENQEIRLSNEIEKLKSDLAESEQYTFEKISTLKGKNEDLLKKLVEKENHSTRTVDRQALEEVQNNLDSVTLKYRDLLHSFNTIKDEHVNDLEILKETINLLEQQKTELHSNLVDVITKEHIYEALVANNDTEIILRKLAQSEVNEIAEKQRANHMSNLYNLVKEQLQKTEQRLLDFQKQNQETLQKNLIFQENIKNLENKLLNYVDVTTHKSLECKHANCVQEIQKLWTENRNLKSQLLITQKLQIQQRSSTGTKSLEILNLKHQILDLQANGDDKALIARLSSDVVLARLSETQFKTKLESLELELKECQCNCDTLKDLLEQTKQEKDISNENLKVKLNILEQILQQQRQQYYGSTPLFFEEGFIANIQQSVKDKQMAFKLLQKMLKQESDSVLLKEQLNKQLQLAEELRRNFEDVPEHITTKLQSLHQEEKLIKLKELKFNREMDFKNMQLKQLSYRLSVQDDHIIKLQEELLQCYNKHDYLLITKSEVAESNDIIDAKVTYAERKILKEQEIQTSPELMQLFKGEGSMETTISNLQTELNNMQSAVKEKDELIEQYKSKITEIEMNVSLFRTQIGDKQSQITFYEKHILELQNKLSKTNAVITESTAVIAPPSTTNEVILLKDALNNLKEINLEKDNEVLKYQTLLKQDRDKHSLAAARTQQELKRFQDIIAAQDKAYKQLKENSIKHPGKAAIEQYIRQVHQLENHTAELHTTVSSLNSQLQASRQEAARWQTLANERLDSMEELRTDLEEQHQNEITAYKKDSERWREEISKLKKLMNKHRSGIDQEELDVTIKLKEKDEKINELSTALKNNERSKHRSEKLDVPTTKPIEFPNDQLLKEHQILKKQYEQIIVRERNAKDEIHKLKEQLLKRPISARSDKNEKEQLLQKKIATLEKENENLREKLEKQSIINEAHRVTVTEDFEKWKKQKYWQQTSEKLKTKLNEKTDEFEKLHQTCASYKILIERLEKEKHTLEDRLKMLRANSTTVDITQMEMLKVENEQLHLEVETLNAKLQMQQHHAGGLGAAMLQDKLEAQERKIAVLELTSKGNSEIRAELEHLQSNIGNLQKINLRLEAENLELKLDLEKFGNDAPHLREQIQHLERYIEVLKSENQNMQMMSECGDRVVNQPVDSKKVTELEKTVFVLKRVVEKLQVENKRLQGGGRPCSVSDRSVSSDFRHLKEQYAQSIQKVARLEDQLKLSNNKIMVLEKRSLSAEVASLSSELSEVKTELSHKSLLLDKVKVLLHRAATKEKSLLDEIAALKSEQSPHARSTENALD